MADVVPPPAPIVEIKASSEAVVYTLVMPPRLRR
jgi:hypothetical protein